MKTNRQKIGILGERKAQAYLKRRGYQILECNYRTKGGELDIIAKQQDCIVFVEVKTRTNEEYGTPADAVSVYKQRHMLKSARDYLLQFDRALECRFDVIEVVLKKQGLFWHATVNHLKNVMQ